MTDANGHVLSKAERTTMSAMFTGIKDDDSSTMLTRVSFNKKGNSSFVVDEKVESAVLILYFASGIASYIFFCFYLWYIEPSPVLCDGKASWIR